MPESRLRRTREAYDDAPLSYGDVATDNDLSLASIRRAFKDMERLGHLTPLDDIDTSDPDSDLWGV